jgi:hypothetical protein
VGVCRDQSTIHPSECAEVVNDYCRNGCVQCAQSIHQSVVRPSTNLVGMIV